MTPQNNAAPEVAASSTAPVVLESPSPYPTFADRARVLTVRGIPVAPVDPGAKRCTLSGWPALATTDQTQIEAWAAQNPNYNTAAVGKPDGFVILDSDSDDLADRIKRDTGKELPDTFTVRSGGKGYPHVYFRQTERTRALGNRNTSGRGFDWQSVNKYVVGPGSQLAGGGEYTIINDSPIVACPGWLADWVEKNSGSEKRAGGDGPKVLEDFDFYAFLEHYGIEGDQDGNWFITDVCPIAGHKHEQSNRTGFFYDGEHFGFHCFAGNCAGNGMSIGQVIAHLNTSDGLRVVKAYDGPIWSELSDAAAPVLFKTPAISGSDHDYVLGPLPGQTRPPEGHFPLGEVSLIAGSSGAGKSTILYAIAEAQKAGRPIYGRPTYGRPYLILLHDRSGRDVRITFERLGLNEADVDYHVFDAAERKQRVGEVLTKILEERTPNERPQVVLIEGLDMAISGQDKMDRVTPELNLLQDVATHFHVAIVGTVGSPKIKIGEAFANDRDRVFGSIVWSRKSASIWVLVPEGEKRERVKLSMMPRHSSRQEVTLAWEDGQLIEVTEEQLEREGDKTMLEWVCEQGRFTKEQFKKATKSSGATATKKLEGLKRAGLVAERYDKGARWYEVKPAEVGLEA